MHGDVQRAGGRTGPVPDRRGDRPQPLLQLLVLPNLELAATLARLTELVAGAVLLLTAFEVLRRRFAGPFGAEHGYEPLVALASSLAAFAVGTMSLAIYLIEGGRWPSINANFSLSSPIAIELLIVPFALGIAWLELGRFRALRGAGHPPQAHARPVPMLRG